MGRLGDRECPIWGKRRLSRAQQPRRHPRDVNRIVQTTSTRQAQIADGTAKVDGDAGILKQVASTMVDFDPRFEIMPGTKTATVVAKEEPYEADAPWSSPLQAAYRHGPSIQMSFGRSPAEGPAL
ncbi:MAG TPA: alkyl sulfatase C-terminal domain-containing protein [Xanthobacteraceae bacterium]|nr:alkyl sulfatase C-terminal domain-containing protein [Xanthobacteraceae bacterium]